MPGQRSISLLLMLLATFALAGCERGQKDTTAAEAAGKTYSIDSPEGAALLKEAIPGAQIVPYDPQQMKKLGPSAVPGILVDSQVSELTKRALSGDGPSAYQLVHHFNLVGNDKESQHWARIGAENGEYNSMMLMGFEYGDGQGLDACVRAVYWFSRAKKDLQSGAQSPYMDILTRAADEEIAKVRKKTEGC